MRRAIRPTLLSAVALLAAGISPGQDRPAVQPKQPPVMVRKLTHAQKVLEAITREDFDMLRIHADGLAACVKDETWRMHQTDRYVMFSADISRDVESLRKAAKDKKGDAAALAFIDMTLTCVKCHRYLRDNGLVRVPDLGPLTPSVAAAK